MTAVLSVDARVEAARAAALDSALRMTTYSQRPLLLPHVDRAGALPMLIFPGVDAVVAMEQYGTFRLSDRDGESWTQDHTAFAFGTIAGITVDGHAWNIVVSWPAENIEDTGRCWFPRCDDGLSGCEHIGELDPVLVQNIHDRIWDAEHGYPRTSPPAEPYSVSVAACKCPIWQLGDGGESIIHATGCTLHRDDVLAEMIA